MNYGVTGFGMSSLYKNLFYIINQYYGQIGTFDDNWNYLSNSTSFISPCNMVTIGSNIFITDWSYLSKTDLLLNILKQLRMDHSTYGIYYNCSNNLIYLTAPFIKTILYFDLNLVYIGSFLVYPYTPCSIAGYSNQMFVGTLNGYILVIVNQTIINSFMGCNGNSIRIISILFDNYGNMATASDSASYLYLYNTIGVFQNKNISLQTGYPNFISFNSRSELVVSTWRSVYIYN